MGEYGGQGTVTAGGEQLCRHVHRTIDEGDHPAPVRPPVHRLGEPERERGDRTDR